MINIEYSPVLTTSKVMTKPKLSHREEECAKHLLQGLSSKEIAKELGLSYRTIEIYISSLKEKLHCRKTSYLIVTLIKLGYINVDSISSPYDDGEV